MISGIEENGGRKEKAKSSERVSSYN